MGFDTGISWTTHSWNPWRGCSKVSPGCKNCYMFTMLRRWGEDPTNVVRAKKPTFYSILSKRMKPGDHVFTCSLSDFFIRAADEWRPEAWNLIEMRPDLEFLILTKRNENVEERLPRGWDEGDFDHVRIGVSAETQEALELRWSEDDDSPISCISVEPILEPVCLRHLTRRPAWVVVGGESGPKYRPCEVEWIIDVVDQCRDMAIPVFVKQDNAFIPDQQGRIPDDYWMIKEYPV